jgi:2-desacetyl-2-hydroxyethyl bacteriochlorophyllide A dehydrogenase
MKAAVFYGPKEGLKLENIKRPEITPHQVLVKIKSCGICSGDVQRLQGQIKVEKTPLVLGHEPSGVIAQVGSEAKGFKEGDRVALFATGCGQCYYCRIGKDNVCDFIAQNFGLGYDGAYAEYTVANPKDVFKLPDQLPFESGSVLSAPTATAYHASRLAQVKAGDTTAVFGAGCLGTQAIQLHKIMGARVIAVDIADTKLELAKSLGADAVINAKERDAVKEIKTHTEGRGADAAFEFAGLPETMLQAIDSVRRGGRIINVGSIPEPISLKMMPFIDEGLALTKELTLQTVSHCSRADMVKLLELVAVNTIDFETGTARVPLTEIHKGFELKKSGDYFRVVVMPEEMPI